MCSRVGKLYLVLDGGRQPWNPKRLRMYSANVLLTTWLRNDPQTIKPYPMYIPSYTFAVQQTQQTDLSPLLNDRETITPCPA